MKEEEQVRASKKGKVWRRRRTAMLLDAANKLF